MLQLCQLYLQLAFPGPCSLREDVQDQRSPIQNFTIEDSFKVAALGGRKFVVENDRIHIGPMAVQRKFVGFAFAKEGAGTGRNQLLQPVSDNSASRSSSQL